MNPSPLKSILPELEGWAERLVEVLLSAEAKSTTSRRPENDGARKWATSRRTKEQTIADFWMRTDVRGPNECWEWLGNYPGIQKNKYGSVWQFGKERRASRVAAEFKYGDYPNELRVLHSCDNTRCVNPHHLFLGTDRMNTEDMFRKGRARRLKGSEATWSRLSEEDVAFIRSQVVNKKYGWGRKMAQKFNVSPNTICAVVAERNWKHV